MCINSSVNRTVIHNYKCAVFILWICNGVIFHSWMAYHSTIEFSDLPARTVRTEISKKIDIKLLKGDDLQEFHFNGKKLCSIQCKLQTESCLL